MEFTPIAEVAEEPEDFFSIDFDEEGDEVITETMAEHVGDLSEIPSMSPGTLAVGHIIKFNSNDVYVDIAHKTEGVIPRGEFDADEVQLGAKVEALVVKTNEDDGSILLSKRKARVIRAWDEADAAFQGEGLIQAKVVAKVKGGLQANFKGLKGFIPGSLMSLHQEYDLEKYIGQVYEFKIIEFNRRRRNMVLSRKAILQAERKKEVAKALVLLEEGQVCNGVVKNITDYGAFVSILDGKIDGLLHKADMSWGHVRDISDYVQVNGEVEVKILNVDRDNEKVSLGLKQLRTDPWDIIESTFRVGEVCTGQVKNITHFGAFVEIAQGIEGLVHISDMSWTERVKHPKDLVENDQEVQVKILNIDPDERKVALGMKQVQPDPWSMVGDNFQVGEVVRGTVKNLTDFGAFVELQEGVEGLIHISDMSWTGRVKHPTEVLNTNDTLEVKILDIDPRNKKISLGLKQVNPDPWEIVDITYPIGSVTTGTVRRLQEYGAFIELTDGIQGLLHVSDISWTDRVDDPGSHVKEGDEIKVKILEINKTERKISLGLKQLENEPWKDVKTKYPVGSLQKGDVTRLTQYGAFVELEPGVEGLLHISDFSWTERVEKPEDMVKEGQNVELRVLEVNEDDRKISLGLKQVKEDPYQTFHRLNPKGSICEAEVLSINEFGVLVKLPGDLEGLVRHNQVSGEPGKRAEDVLKVGQKTKVRIMEVSLRDRKIKVSIRQVAEFEERKAMKNFARQQNRDASRSGGGGSEGSIGAALGADTMAALRNMVSSDEADSGEDEKEEGEE
jgi:small subunit ribosomal protein S1